MPNGALLHAGPPRAATCALRAVAAFHGNGAAAELCVRHETGIQMLKNPMRFVRGLVGTALTWGVAWSALQTAVLFVRRLPNPPEGVTPGRVAVAILGNQSVRALVWGTVLGALFSFAVALMAQRWPNRALQPGRLARIGGIVGLGLGALLGGAGAWADGNAELLVPPAIAVAAIAATGAGLGGLLGYLAAKARQAIGRESTSSSLPRT